jgi:hypothetical protein
METCELFEGFAHKVARVVFGSDKRGNLGQVRRIGPGAFVQDRIACGRT